MNLGVRKADFPFTPWSFYGTEWRPCSGWFSFQGSSNVLNTYLFSITHHYSLLPVGRWLDLGHLHHRWLSDVSLVADPLSGCGCFCDCLQQKGDSGNLQPQLSGKGRLSSGNVEHDATLCCGETDLGAFCLPEREVRTLWTWGPHLSVFLTYLDSSVHNWAFTEIEGKIPLATLKTFMVQPDIILLLY